MAFLFMITGEQSTLSVCQGEMIPTSLVESPQGTGEHYISGGRLYIGKQQMSLIFLHTTVDSEHCCFHRRAVEVDGKTICSGRQVKEKTIQWYPLKE